MEIPIVFFFVMYMLTLGAFFLGSAFVLYHAIKFGQASKLNTGAMSVYILVSVAMISFSLWYASIIDWASSIDLIVAFELIFL